MALFKEHQPYSFKKFIDGHRFFKIPDYQQSYAWKTKEINNFFSAIIENDVNYFIGIVVAAEPVNDSKRYEIVDGQQRFTTLSLSLIALRALLQSQEFISNEKAEKIVRNINVHIKQFDPDQDKHVSVLEPGRDELVKIYESILENPTLIQQKSLDKTQQNYFNNYTTLTNLVDKYVSGDIEKAEELYQKIVNAQFIALVLSTEDDLQEIYDGLNSTGLGLSVAEQVKNKLLQRAKTLNVKSDIDSIWDELESMFAKIDPALFPKYLRHYWIANKSYISNKNLYGQIREEILGLDAESLVSWTENLLCSAQIYCLIYSKKAEDFVTKDAFNQIPQALIDQLLSFRVLDNTQIYPTLLAIINRFKAKDGYTEKYIEPLLRALWNFCLRTSLVSVSPADYEKILANLASIIREAPILQVQNKSNEEIKKLAKLVSADDQFKRNFEESLSYSSDPKLVTAILARIIASYDPTIKLTQQDVEHIIPQTPKKWGLKKGILVSTSTI